LESSLKHERLQCRSQTIPVEIIQTTVKALGQQTFWMASVETNARLETVFLGRHFPSKTSKWQENKQYKMKFSLNQENLRQIGWKFNEYNKSFKCYQGSETLQDSTSRRTNVETI
jgi:hypothetical protein